MRVYWKNFIIFIPSREFTVCKKETSSLLMFLIFSFKESAWGIPPEELWQLPLKKKHCGGHFCTVVTRTWPTAYCISVPDPALKPKSRYCLEICHVIVSTEVGIHSSSCSSRITASVGNPLPYINRAQATADISARSIDSAQAAQLWTPS